MNPFTAERASSIGFLGEVALLKQMRQWMGGAAPAAPAGMGDDCAVLQARVNLLTTDIGGSIIGKHLHFSPRLQEGQFLAKRGEVVSCIDVTDGISKDLLHLLDDEQAAELDPHSLPIHADLATAVQDPRVRLERMLCDGEDYELLFTVPLSDYDKVKNHPDISIIGRITDKNEGINLANKHGQAFPLQAQGWKHF